MRQSLWIRQFLYAVIGLNLITLYIMFIAPRNEYIKKHNEWSSRQIQDDIGTHDIPNIFRQDYIVAYKIKDRVPENGLIWIDSSDNELIHPSVAGQVLYPRKIIWADSLLAVDSLTDDQEIYIVTGAARI